MAVGADNFTLSDLSFNRRPRQRHHRAHTTQLVGAWQMIELQGSRVYCIPAVGAPSGELDVVQPLTLAALMALYSCKLSITMTGIMLTLATKDTRTLAHLTACLKLVRDTGDGIDGCCSVPQALEVPIPHGLFAPVGSVALPDHEQRGGG